MFIVFLNVNIIFFFLFNFFPIKVKSKRSGLSRNMNQKCVHDVYTCRPKCCFKPIMLQILALVCLRVEDVPNCFKVQLSSRGDMILVLC